MKRFFTLIVFSTFIFLNVANSQTCATSATCSTFDPEDFNSDDGGFTGSAGFAYNNPDGAGPLGNFQAVISQSNNTPPTQQLVSPDYAGSNTVVLGFVSAGVTGTYTVNIRNASGDAIIATCAVNVTTASSTYCISITNTAIGTATVYIEFLFDNVNGANGAGTLSFDDFRTNLAPGAALPVSFIGFDAQKLTNGTQLTWKVGAEQNVKGYEVEKSMDGRNYSTIGFVSATGQSSYSFKDGQLTDRMAFYRIKNVDFDGAFKYSNILSVKNGTASIVFNAFPLPARTQLTIQHPVITGNGSMSISSTDGRIIQRIIPVAGSIQTVFNVSSLAKGIYILRLNDGSGQLQTLKFAKE